MYIDYTAVGKRISDRRHELGLKQVEVNETANLSDKYLSNIETARSIPSIDVLMRICTALNTTPDHLLLGTVRENNIDMADMICEQIRVLNDAQLTLLANFMDWLIKQKL